MWKVILFMSAACFAQPFWDSQNARKIQGRPVAATAPGDGEVLAWDAATGRWIPSAAAAGGVSTVTAGATGALSCTGTTNIVCDLDPAYINGSSWTFTGAVSLAGASASAPAKTGTSLPGTCSTGDQYFKSDATAGSNLYGCVSNVWTVLGGSETGGIKLWMRDTTGPIWSPFCLVGTGRYGFGWAGQGGTFSNIADANTSGYPCAVRLEVSGAGDQIYAYMGDNGDKIFRASDNIDLYFLAKVNTATDKEQWMGWNTGITNAGANGCYIYRGAADTTWKVYCRVASVDQAAVTITGATVDTNWHVFRIRKSGGTVYASVDGGTEYSTTNVPSSTSGATPWISHKNTSGGASTGTMWIAKFAMRGAN